VGTPKRTEGRVLIVDDDPDIRTLLQIVLGEEGFEVECASGADEAADALGLESHSRPDVVVRRSGRGERRWSISFGADEYIIEPFSPRALVTRIRAVLSSVLVPEDLSELA
jgi:DNA-binding response OmpR family regulator